MKYDHSPIFILAFKQILLQFFGEMKQMEMEMKDVVIRKILQQIIQIEWHEFANLLASKLDLEDENYFKETFRVFSKNDEGMEVK